MKAIGLFEFGGPEKLTVVDVDEPRPGPSEIRIRVHAAAVNPTDTLFRRGLWAAQLKDRRPPFTPGVDAAGVVDAIGAGADGRLVVGDRVVAYVDPTGPHGGAYAEKIIVPGDSVVPAPSRASMVEAATLILNALTARLALDALRLRGGDPLLISGAPGAVGSYVIQLARAERLRVIADAGSAADEAVVRSLGADEVVPRGEGFVAAVRAIVPAGAAGFIDGAVLNEKALPAIADGAGFVTLRRWAGPTQRGIVLHAIMAPDEARNTSLLDRLRRNVDEGLLSLRAGAVLPAKEASEAHRRLEAGGSRGRIVLDFTAQWD